MTDRDVISLREYVDRMLAAHEAHDDTRFEDGRRTLQAALLTLGVAADKTERALGEYKTQANEWRGLVTDLTSKMMVRADFEREHKALADKWERQVQVFEDQIVELKEWKSNLQGRIAVTVVGGSLLVSSAISLIVKLVIK